MSTQPETELNRSTKDKNDNNNTTAPDSHTENDPTFQEVYGKMRRQLTQEFEEKYDLKLDIGKQFVLFGDMKFDPEPEQKDNRDIVTKICDSLQKTYQNNGGGEYVVECFRNYVDNEFEDNAISENIIEDLSENVQDSGIIDGMNDELDWDEPDLEKLFEIMTSAIGLYTKYNKKNINLHTTPKRKQPSHINPHNFNLNITMKQQKDSENFLIHELNDLPYDRREILRTAAKLRCIGLNNYIPSFSTLLWDTLTRFRCIHLTDKFDPNAKHIMQVCPYFKNKLYNIYQDCETFMDYIVEPKGIAPKLQYWPLTRMNDKQIIHAHYLFAMNGLIYKLLMEYPNMSWPMQLDVWIIPVHVEQKKMRVHEIVFNSDSDIKDSEFLEEWKKRKKLEEETDEDSVDNTNIYGMKSANRANEYVENTYVYEDRIYDIPNRLELSEGTPQWIDDYIPIKQCTLNDNDIDKTRDIIYNKLIEFMKLKKHMKDKRGEEYNGFKYKRYMIVIDRRIQGYDSILEDRLFVYQPPKKWGVFPMDYCEEMMLQNTKNYVLGNTPRMHYYKHCGGYTDFTGHQNLFSFHVHNVDKIRSYWYINGSVTRWFPQYLYTLMPRYFKSQDVRHLVSESIVKSKWKFKFKDDTFEQWYEMVVNGNQSITHIPTEVIGLSQYYQNS
eukprot:44115_1